MQWNPFQLDLCRSLTLSLASSKHRPIKPYLLILHNKIKPSLFLFFYCYVFGSCVICNFFHSKLVVKSVQNNASFKISL